jgi:hypothetical protein
MFRKVRYCAFDWEFISRATFVAVQSNVTRDLESQIEWIILRTTWA